MANFERIVDRAPYICAAGKPTRDPEHSVRNCLHQYNLQDEVDALKHDGGIFEERPAPIAYKVLHTENNRHRGIFTEAHDLIRPPDVTNYQTLINDLKETSYNSYWNKVLGRSQDPVPGLPAGMEPLAVTFGTPSKQEHPLKDLVNPPKTVYEVLYDSQVGHEMYKKTHDDYNPSEQLTRNYTKAFDKAKRYGMRTTYDPRGIWVRCACHWHESEPVKSAYLIQAQSLERRRSRLGKILAPNNNIDCVPEGHRFGKPCKRELYGVPELLKDSDCPPCVFQRDFRTWMEYLNHMRNILKNKNRFHFDLKDFERSILYYDKEHTGWVRLELLYKICKCYRVNFELTAMEPFFYLLGVFADGEANYRAFVDILDVNKPMVELFKLEDIPVKNLYFVTTSQASNCDFLQIDHTNLPPAGVPSHRLDSTHSSIPENGCLADLDNLGEETSAAVLMNPSIYTHYGLSHRDFLKPRSPETIRKLFENVGYELTDETFKALWKIGLERDKSGCVCVDTFKKLLKEHSPPANFKLTENDKC